MPKIPSTWVALSAGRRGASAPVDGLQGVLMRWCRSLNCTSGVALSVHRGRIMWPPAARTGSLGEIERLIGPGQPFHKLAVKELGQASGADSDGVLIGRCDLPGLNAEVLLMRIAADAENDLLFVAFPTARRPPFGINDERSSRRISEWIGDYARLWWRLRADQRRSESLTAALDLIGFAVLVIDGRGEVTPNRAGSAMLARGDGLRLVNNSLATTILDDTVRLQSAIAHVRAATADGGSGDHQSAPVLSVRRHGRRPLSVAIMRGHAYPSLSEQSVVLHVIDPETDFERPMTPTCEMFGLTGAEARLTKLLVSGASLSEAAQQLRIQEPTARTYLKQAFAKTGTKRQSALIQLLLTSMISPGPGVELMAMR